MTTEKQDGTGAVISEPVELSEPIVRGEDKIGFIQVRRPKAGELRGLSMHDLVKLEVDTMRVLLPRVTIPPLITQEVDELCPADLLALSGEVASFFLPKGTLTDSPPQ